MRGLSDTASLIGRAVCLLLEAKAETKSVGVCSKDIKRVKIEIDGKIIERVTEFRYLGNRISEFHKDIEYKLQAYNRTYGTIKRNFGKQMTTETKLRTHNIASKAGLRYGSEMWVQSDRGKQSLEAAQMKFWRPLLGFKKIDHQRNV
jgi:hypothetical protein